jgi:hypothetical protein
MPNPSNSPHVATTPSQFVSGEGVLPSVNAVRMTLLVLALVGTGWPVCAQAVQAPGAPTVPAVAPAPAGFQMTSLRPALGNVQEAIAGLSIAHWKAPAETRAAIQQDVASMQRDLTTTLPSLMAQADAPAGNAPAALSPSFAVFRNLDALYDVLLRVTETAALAGPSSDASSLEDARAGLEDGRGKLGTWLLQSIGAQDAQIARARATVAPAAPAPPAAPAKIVVNDGPENPKPKKKKPAPAQVPQ